MADEIKEIKLDLDELERCSESLPINQKVDVAVVDHIMRNTIATVLLPTAMLIVVGFLILGPQSLPAYKQNLLALTEGLFAACIYYWLGGQIVGELGLKHKWAKLTVRYAGAIGIFFVIWLLSSPYNPFGK